MICLFANLWVVAAITADLHDTLTIEWRKASAAPRREHDAGNPHP
jgi:hypothetical protein